MLMEAVLQQVLGQPDTELIVMDWLKFLQIVVQLGRYVRIH